MNISAYRPFDGIFVPLITPFHASMEIDWEGLRRLVAFYAQQGVAGFVPCGSTGEASTLTVEEHKAVISFVIEQAASHGDFKIIAATGSNDTREAIDLTRHAHQAGADACLSVTPYYVRPNRSGLLAHYQRIAEVGSPLFLYNIPLRTGLNLSLEDIELLVQDVPAVIGIKEATADIQQLIDVAHRFADSDCFTVLSGEDSLLFDCCTHGGRGSICAASLVYPREMVQLHHMVSTGHLHEAAALNRRMRPKVRALFCESNPVAMKLAVSRLLGTSPTVRLPLGPASKRAVQIIDGLGLQCESEAESAV
ncbi:4-hydroxy-tetrahydrodipicolinate synthase [Thiomonas bhubaneswarensis]|uniref:4-hydroxy-tetrahydrodipicolinate synthase n=1 Tax=Thiomonas bhubaneswarensis TaxID=339866 RepID=A0A0K6I082_9BURK|nr:4-hydroxy-tetrahydrodipicolinate synthase [Thiomonas bhubaneswarensis]CUA96540.1 4-hydroxy-tetrahydrodipicolinate synthase [Thiomonas bhubaneswarensis]